MIDHSFPSLTRFHTTLLSGASGLLLAIILWVPSAAHADDAKCGPSQAELDWVAKDRLTPAQQQALPVGCDGAFVDPQMDAGTKATLQAGEDSEEPITISGTDSQSTRQSTLMSGDVVLIQGKRKITGDTAELFDDPQGVRIDGHVSFREPGFLLRGEHADISLEQNTLQVDDARYVLHAQGVHGEAKQIRRDGSGVINLEGGTYSSCSPENEVWYLKSSSMTLDPQRGEGEATNVRLEMFDVPLFYFPYLRFPIGSERHSGFLAPSFANSENGIDFALPYYMNLAPNYDATVIPRYIADRGAQLGGEFRHLSPLFTSTVSATWLDDQLTGDNRWLTSIKQNGGHNQPWSTLIDITRVSDNQYFDDLDNIGLSVSRSTNLKQHGMASYTTDHWLTQAGVESFQTLRDSIVTDPYETLPDLRATGDYQFNNGFFVQLDQHYTAFEHHDTTQVTGSRFALDYQSGWRSDWQAGFIEPSVYVHYLEQQLNNAPADEHPEIAVPAASLDMGLFFVRQGTRYTQTLEPRVYYYYADYENQDHFHLFNTDETHFSFAQLFRNYRFSGADRIGDANQTSVGVTSQWLDNQSGNTWLEMGVGQIFYNTDRRIKAYDPASFALLPPEVQSQYQQARSPVSALMQWWFHPLWHISSELAWNDNNNNTESGNVFLHYEGVNKELFSIGYRHVQLLTQLNATTYIQETATQSDLSVFWPLSNQWALMGRSNYDFSHSRQLELLGGFQYEDCCWRLRTVYRQWARNPKDVFDTTQHQEDRGIYIEVQFKNLAGLGTKTNNMLKDSIYGYNASE